MTSGPVSCGGEWILIHCHVRKHSNHYYLSWCHENYRSSIKRIFICHESRWTLSRLCNCQLYHQKSSLSSLSSLSRGCMYLLLSSEVLPRSLTSSRSSMREMMAASCSTTLGSASCSALSPGSTTALLATYWNMFRIASLMLEINKRFSTIFSSML